jgi:hypothetical protein
MHGLYAQRSVRRAAALAADADRGGTRLQAAEDRARLTLKGIAQRLQMTQARVRERLQILELAAGAPERSNPRVRNAPATPDTAAQWKSERQDAQRVEETYRAAVADWKPQRPPTKVT